MGAAPELSTTFALTFALTLLSCNACGSYDRRPHADRASLRRRGACARRSRAGVEARDVRVLVERVGIEQGRRPSGTWRWDLGGQVQMAQDALDHRGLFDQRDQPEAPATDARTRACGLTGGVGQCLRSGRQRSRRGPGWRSSVWCPPAARPAGAEARFRRSCPPDSARRPSPARTSPFR